MQWDLRPNSHGEKYSRRCVPQSKELEPEWMYYSAQPLTDFTYASRSRQSDFEPTRKDDLESWMYCVSTVSRRNLLSIAHSFHLPYFRWWRCTTRSLFRGRTRRLLTRLCPLISLRCSSSRGHSALERVSDLLYNRLLYYSNYWSTVFISVWKNHCNIVPDEFKRIIEAQKVCWSTIVPYQYRTLQKVKGYFSPDYSLTWHLLVTACIRYEVEPFAYFSWNRGNTVPYSTL